MSVHYLIPLFGKLLHKLVVLVVNNFYELNSFWAQYSNPTTRYMFAPAMVKGMEDIFKTANNYRGEHLRATFIALARSGILRQVESTVLPSTPKSVRWIESSMTVDLNNTTFFKTSVAQV